MRCSRRRWRKSPRRRASSGRCTTCLFENQLHLKGPNLRGYAERLQLDMARYSAELDDHIYLQRVREHAQSGRNSGVRGTPGFFVNRAIQDVSFGMHRLFEAVEAALHHR